jgi:hypothetical protein
MTSVAMECLTQIQKLLLEVKKQCKFSGRVKAKLHKMRASSIGTVTKKNTCKKRI